jgi:probable HAF family extracellular repeat protein
MRIVITLALAALCAGASRIAPFSKRDGQMTTTYSYTTVDDPAATNSTNGTYAQGINDMGEVVGYYYDSAGNAHGFLDMGGIYTTLDFSSGTNNQTFPEGINDKGQIVGWYNDRSSDHGFLYSGGTYTALDDPLATVNTVARGINDKGQVVGYYQDGVSGGGLVNHGFIYSRGIYTTLDDPLAVSPSFSNGTVALGINDKGQIVGYYFDSSSHENGFLYSGGKYTTLDDPLGVDGTVATGINDKGQVLVIFTTISTTNTASFTAAANTPPLTILRPRQAHT